MVFVSNPVVLNDPVHPSLSVNAFGRAGAGMDVMEYWLLLLPGLQNVMT
jgi:hypothetical protein